MPICIGRHVIGTGSPLVVAEAGVNHNGDPRLALALVDAAADCGADAVKFQTFRAEALALDSAPQATYQRERASAASQRAMLELLELPHAALVDVRRRADERGIVFLSTPFDAASLAELVMLDVAAIKIGSGDLTNLGLLREAAATRKPLLLSTGMADEDEIARVLRALGSVPLVLLHCTSAYPAPIEDANLRAMATMRERFGVPIGYSDHTPGIDVAMAAAALGAVVIEKHLTLDRSMRGPDHAASLDPSEFRRLVIGVRDVVAALGDGVKRPQPSEEGMSVAARRSLVTARSIAQGHIIRPGDLVAKRPGTGISPMDVDRFTNAVARRALPVDHLITLDDFDEVAQQHPE